MNEENLATAPEAESAAPLEEAPDNTPETVVEEPAVAPEEEAPAEEVEPESEQPAEEEQPADEDILADDSPPTIETVQKLRIPQVEKDKLVKVIEQNTANQLIVESIGGEFGATVLGPLAKIINKAEATDAELNEALTGLGKGNKTVSLQLITGAAQGLLTAPEFADPLLQSVFGENATLKKVKQLIALDKEDLIDIDSSIAFLADNEDYIAKRDREAEVLRQEIADLRANKANPVSSPVVKGWEEDFSTETPSVLKPTFERVHWDNNGALAKLVTEVLQNRLKRHEYYTNTEKYINDTGVYKSGDNVIHLAKANLHLLKNMTDSQGRQMIREVMADIRKISENSRNAIKAKEKQTAEVAKKEAKALDMPKKELSAEEQEKMRDAKFKAQMRGEEFKEKMSAV